MRREAVSTMPARRHLHNVLATDTMVGTMTRDDGVGLRQARRWRAMLAGLSLLTAAAGTAHAEESKEPNASPGVICPICSRIRDPRADYATKAGNTLARGATNTLLGWTELIQQPAHEVKTYGGRNTRNVLTGMAKGLGQGVRRTFGGLAELVTFWSPQVDGQYLRFSDDCPLCMGQHPPAPKRPAKPSR